MVITRVAPLSFAKIAGVLYALLGLIFGAFISLAALVGSAFASDEVGGTLAGLLFGAGAIVVLPIFYGCLGFVMTLVMASLYNLVSGIVGGFEIDVK